MRQAQALIIHESATLGPTGEFGGLALSSGQFLGSRFHIDAPVEVTDIGGHLATIPGVGNELLFGAIVSLAGPTALPSGAPFDRTLVALTTFKADFPSTDFLTPLSVTLPPGDYALIFGAGQFGATGDGFMTIDNTDIPGRASYISWDGSSWRNSIDENLRFVVVGNRQFCQKGSVRAVLDPVFGRFPGNAGPDVIVRVDLGESIQEAIDSAADANNDGYIIIGVVNNATGEPGGHVQQRIVIDDVYTLPFALLGCSVTLHDPTPEDGQPTARITAAAASPDLFIMDLHAADSQFAGWVVAGNSRYLRNVAARNNAIGLWFVGNDNTLHNGSATGNRGVGILVLGQGNTITGADAVANGRHGIRVLGNRNQLLQNDVGDEGKGNGGDGMNVRGAGNVLRENDAFANRGNGIAVSGGTSAQPNVLRKNRVGDVDKGNGGHGLLVNGIGNGTSDPVEVQENTAIGNGRTGIKVVGSGHELQKNSSRENGGCAFEVAAHNLDATENKANGVTIAGSDGSPFPTGCIGKP